MKEILNFKNTQDMANEADDFLAKVTDPEIKACARLLLVSAYSYLNEFIADNTKKTYKYLVTLIKYEMMETTYKNGVSNLYLMLQQAPEKSPTRKIYELYYNCLPDVKKNAQMHLMNLLLPFYVK